MKKVWLSQESFWRGEEEHLINSLKGLIANYTVGMSAIVTSKERVDCLNACQDRIEEFVRAGFLNLKRGCDVEEDSKILRPDEVAGKIEVNKYLVLESEKCLDDTAARDLLSDEENHEILFMLGDFLGVGEAVGWLNYYGGDLKGEPKRFLKGDVVYEVARLAESGSRKEQYSVVVGSAGLAWTIVKSKDLAWLGREVR